MKEISVSDVAQEWNAKNEKKTQGGRTRSLEWALYVLTNRPSGPAVAVANKEAARTANEKCIMNMNYLKKVNEEEGGESL